MTHSDPERTFLPTRVELASPTLLANQILPAHQTPPAPLPQPNPIPPLTLPARLPLSVHRTLIDAGLLPHPYRNNAYTRTTWVEDCTWHIHLTFHVDSLTHDRIELVLDGLDLIAEVAINGLLIGTHQNVYRPARFDVRHAITPGENRVTITLHPPLAGVQPPAGTVDTAHTLAAIMHPDATEPDGSGVIGDLRSVTRRKPTMDWGWDFAPRLPKFGLRTARIECGHPTRFTSLTLATSSLSLSPSPIAEVVARSRITGTQPGTPVRVRLTSPTGEVITGEGAVDTNGEVAIPLTVEGAMLWWTNDLGDQPLYHLEATAAGATMETLCGIRTIELDRSRQAGGRNFRFVLNGTPVFARGASVVPSDLLGEGDNAALVAVARGAGMNMLRVWAGGGYGSDELYSAADRLGVLIWQDFPFTCADQVEDLTMVEEVTAEATYQVGRLAAHPSLAVLVGNNEVHALHQLAHRSLGPGPWGWHYFHRVLPGVVDACAPEVPYWPGSPYGEDDPAGVNGVADGDRHAWEVWHGLDVGAPSPQTYTSYAQAAHFHRYRYDTGRFISEFGILSAATEQTLREWIGEDQWALYAPGFVAHICDRPPDKVLALLDLETGMPGTVSEFVHATQVLQAEGLKYGIEHYRRLEPHTTGALVWQLNEPWPGMSWALLDHAGRAKPALAVVRRAFAPVIASFEHRDDGSLHLVVSNSSASRQDIDASVRLETVLGEVLWTGTVRGSCPPHESVRLWTLLSGAVELGADVVARVRPATGDVFPPNRAYFAHLRDIPFPTPEFTHRFTRLSANCVRVDVTAHTTLHCLHVHVDGGPGCGPLGGGPVTVSDDALDLSPGESLSFTVRGNDLGAYEERIHLHPWVAPKANPHTLQRSKT